MSFKFRIAMHVIVCQCVFDWFPNVISKVPDCNMSHVPPCPSSVGEAHRLDCFQWFGTINRIWQCEWDPGKALNISKYELLIEAPSPISKRCKKYSLTGTSVSIGKLHNKSNMTAYVVDKGLSCTMATFKSPSNIARCCAVDVKLKRSSGQLFVNASWHVDSGVTKYLVMYREYFLDHFKNTTWMMESSQDRHTHTVKNLNSSLSYEVQVQCFITSKCSQCALSKVYIVPQELTRAPIIKNQIMDNYHLGRRKVTISWESPSSVDVSQHTVRIQKVSKEHGETFTMDSNVTSISFLLSHSAYHISLHSSNNVSRSPPAAWAIESALENMEYNGTLSVTFNSNHSFNLSWSNSLMNAYNCYTVEWIQKGDNATAFKSFYSDKNKTKKDIDKGTPAFQPYKRYIFLLHIKLNEEETCNLKQLNNSDITCGRTDAYFLEGTPISAPKNVSQSNVTDSSAVIKWLPVPEEELRGFLLGYILHYINGGTESNITMDPGATSYKLSGLKSGSDCQVKVAAYTSKGEGKSSPPLYFQIKSSDPSSWILTGIIIGTVVLLLVVHLCCRLLNRFKEVCLWPSIPNPGNSSAFQKTDKEYKLEALELNGVIFEHWDSGPLHLMESSKEEQKNPGNPEASPLLDKERYDKSGQGVGNKGLARRPASGTEQECLPLTATNADSASLECTSTDFGVTGATDTPCRTTEAARAAATAVAPCDPKPAVVFMSDYTTMELFKQANIAPQAKCQPCQPVRLAPPCPPPAGLDYVDQSHFNTFQSSRDETHETETEQTSVL